MMRHVKPRSPARGTAQCRPVRRLSRPLRGSGGKQYAMAEQIEAGATVHLAFDQLEPGDLALRLATAPGCGDCGADRGAVLLQPSRKGLHSAHAGPARVGEPGVQLPERRLRVSLLADAVATHERAEPAGQSSNARSLTVLLDPRDHSGIGH